MTVENLKSAAITNLDATPIAANSEGKGAPGRVKVVGDYATLSASASTTSTYRLVRIPSNCVVKQVLFESEAQGAGKVQLGIYYSDQPLDGTSAANTGAIDAKFFSDDIDCASAVVQGDKTLGTGGTYTLGLRNKALWDAAGLSSDPGGFFDVTLTVHTTAVTTGTGKTGVLVKFI